MQRSSYPAELPEDEPRSGYAWIFVRPVAGGIEATQLMKWEDGSLVFHVHELVFTYNRGPEAWRDTLRHLASLGFVD